MSVLKNSYHNGLSSVFRKDREYKGNYLIEPGSHDEQLLADCYEDGYGLNKTFLVVNTNRKQEVSVNVGKSCIYETHKRLNPQVKDVKKKAQGSDDPHSKWSQAGFLLAKQLNIRFGNIVPPFNDPPLSTTNKGNESKGIIDEIDLYLEIITCLRYRKNKEPMKRLIPVGVS